MISPAQRMASGTPGTITFTYNPTISAAVPEPATWAMMLAGFGLIGSGMRRRNAVMARVTYA